ncbi:MAG: type II toxin-antitoxin system RelE/ParE family toxin [Nitriliruptoraceae bacterium]|nr:type II toxin-antitoxin system RelE/ParE family toxin [Nitriliruptoraceae bacterium]
MAQVELARAAVEDLDRLVMTHSLPGDTRERVRTSLEPLARFPRLGPELTGRWNGFRFTLGPWRWILLVYVFDVPRDRVTIVTIQDARTSSAVTGS